MVKTDKRRKAAPRLPAQVERAVRAAEDKKALDLIVLDLRKAAGFTDYFVICSGANARQVRAIADAVTEALGSDGAKPAHVEGYDRSEWILLDYFDFIVHVFAPEPRVLYSPERLGGSAERLDAARLPSPPRPPPASTRSPGSSSRGPARSAARCSARRRAARSARRAGPRFSRSPRR